MRLLPRLTPFRFLVLALAVIPVAVTAAWATTNHVVISEFATRGPASATDEFVELYNPTDNPIDISGWKLQYDASSAGANWNDRAVLPANTSIAGRAFFLIANTSYSGTTPDYTSSLWTSGTGMSDNASVRIINSSSVEMDRVGWGTGDQPEGSATSNHGTTANGNSVERKANATSTAASLASGADVNQGNGYDTDNNANDFVVQTNGRNPQNAGSSPEPPFSSGGNGTGAVNLSPSVAFTSHAVSSLTFSISQGDPYTVTDITITVPPEWTWSHNISDVSASGAAFSGASKSINGNDIVISGASLTTAHSGLVIVANLTAPDNKGFTTFTTKTAVAAGTLTQIAVQPRVRSLTLVPMVTLHVNDASGVPVSPYAVGDEATVSGIVTANVSTTQTQINLQDGTGAIRLFNFNPPPIPVSPGDALTVTGTISQFRGLTELQTDPNTLFQQDATGQTIPDPLVLTCADDNNPLKPDYTEPNESRLIRINGVTYNATTSQITDNTGTTGIFIPSTFPPTPSVFDVIGVSSQFKPGSPAPGPPYTSDYQISPRVPEDIIAHPGPIILTTPYEDNLQPTSVDLHWTTDVASTSIVNYGLTQSLGSSTNDPTQVTDHTITVTGLTPSTAYYYSVGSQDANGTNYSATALFSTASPAPSTGVMNVYFNKSVNTSVARVTNANGNADLTSKIVTRIDNAQHSVDVALYSLSSTPGSSIATALVNAKNRGVSVRVICEYDNSTSAPFGTISGSGIPLINDRFDPINNGAGLMHNKFFVIDGRGGSPEQAWVFTGSWNPTDSGTNQDYQNSIEIQDQALANTYTIEFNEMWGSNTSTPNSSVSRFGARKYDNTPHKFHIGGKDVESYFSPSDNTNGHILSLLNSAQHSIAFELLTMTRTDLSAALVAKKNAGVAVRGDLDNGSDTGSQYSYLTTNSVDVRLKTGGGGLLHHKYCIVDAEEPSWNPVTLTGSHNWSSTAENSNNENTLIIHDMDITNQYFQEFMARYTQFGGTNPPTVGVGPTDPGPRAVMLYQNEPNPAHGETHIAYAIPSPQRVVLKLYDLQGREVRKLVDRQLPAGQYGIDLDTRGFSSGVYFYQLRTGNSVQVKRMLLLPS